MLDFEKATQAIQYHENILILPSSPVDGDSIGSALAIYSLLQHMGKNATVVLTTDIPDIYKFLPKVDAVKKTVQLYSDFIITIDLKDKQIKDLKHEIEDNKVNIIVTPNAGSFTSEQVTFPEPKKYFDLVITVDCADVTQLGDFYKQNYAVFSDVPSINIDHHVSNKNFASLNLVDTNVASTTQIIYSWFKYMNVEVDPDIATLLLAGIITDTGSFQNANTTPESFDIAADLIDLGGRQQEIIRHVYKTKHLNSLKLWGKILSKIEVNEDLRYLWSSVTRSDFQQTGTTSADKGDIIDDLLSNAQEADVVLLLEEKNDGSLHGSLRSTDEQVNVSIIAQKFNGGGHSMASGFTIPNATVETHQGQILEAIQDFQAARLNLAPPAQNTSETEFPSPIFQESAETAAESPQVEDSTLEDNYVEPTATLDEEPIEEDSNINLPDLADELVPEDLVENNEVAETATESPQIEELAPEDNYVEPVATLDEEPIEEDSNINLPDLADESVLEDLSTNGLLDPDSSDEDEYEQIFDPSELQTDLQNDEDYNSASLQDDLIPDVDPISGEPVEKSIEQLTRDFVSGSESQE